MSVVKLLIVAILFTDVGLASDHIIDKQGNEFFGTVLKIENGQAFFHPDSTAEDSVVRISQSEIFMIKYADGRKVVGQVKRDRAEQDSRISNSRVSVSVQGQYGTFGLFNVGNVFTKADYTLGVTPYLDFRLNRVFSVGVEYMFLFGKPRTNDDFRFIMNPNIRGKGTFVVHPRIAIDAIIAGGFSVWPETEGVAYLDSTFLDSRTGWDVRAALGCDFVINPRFSITLDIGYAANSSVSKNVWITHDMMLVGLGPKVRF